MKKIFVFALTHPLSILYPFHRLLTCEDTPTFVGVFLRFILKNIKKYVIMYTAVKKFADATKKEGAFASHIGDNINERILHNAEERNRFRCFGDTGIFTGKD